MRRERSGRRSAPNTAIDDSAAVKYDGLVKQVRPRHRLFFVLAGVLVLLCADLVVALPHLGAGSSSVAWFVTRRSGESPALVLMMREDPIGSIRPGIALEPLPQAISALGMELLAVYAPFEPGDAASVEDAPETSTRVLRAVRRFEAQAITPNQTIIRGPRALPPIEGPGRLVGIVNTPTPAVLIEHDGELRMLLLERGAWKQTRLPDDLEDDAALKLLPITGRPAILAHAPGSNEAWIHQYMPGEEDTSPAEWNSRVLAFPPDAERVVVVDDQIFAIARGESPDEVRIDAVRSESTITRARLSGVPGEFRVFGLANAIVLAWDASEGEATAPMIAAVGLDGRILRQGAPATIVGPVTAEDVQLLLLVLASIFLTAVIFIARPGSRYESTFTIPVNTALAPPSRRTLAAMIDLAPGLALGISLASGVLPVWGAERWIEGFVGVLLVLAVVTILHAGLSEAFTGRTLGKWICRCWTVSHNGGKPSLVQSFGRNSAKILCPPLALLTVLAPYAPNPGSFATRVVVKVPPESASEPGSGGSDSP